MGTKTKLVKQAPSARDVINSDFATWEIKVLDAPSELYLLTSPAGSSFRTSDLYIPDQPQTNELRKARVLQDILIAYLHDTRDSALAHLRNGKH